MLSIRHGVSGTIFVILFCTSTNSPAEVTLDGTLGPAGPSAFELQGPNYEISADLGQLVGSNLFHSFSRFNLTSEESATFSGPASVNNIVGRVTGGESSSIDGLMRSTIPGANLWFMNPAGILLKENARIDIKGSFYATTADYLLLEDGARFDTSPSGQDSILTTAPPEAFGFDDQPSSIVVDLSKIDVPGGETLSLASGDIDIANGSLVAPNGTLRLVAIGSSGEINVNDSSTTSVSDWGRVDINSSVLDVTGSQLGGKIVIRGGELVISNEANITAGIGQVDLDSQNLILEGSAQISTQGGGHIDLSSQSIQLRDNATVVAEDGSTGPAGTVTIRANEILTLESSSKVFTSKTNESSNDDGGEVHVSTRDLTINNGHIMTRTSGDSGKAGLLTVEAESIEISGGGDSTSHFFSLAEDVTPSLRISARMNYTGIISSNGVSDEGRIVIDSVSDAGDVSIAANELKIDGDPVNVGAYSLTGIGSTALFSTSGNSGQTIVHGKTTEKVNSLEIKDGGAIGSISVFSDGSAGKVTVKADEIYAHGHSENRINLTGTFFLLGTVEAEVPAVWPSTISSSAIAFVISPDDASNPTVASIAQLFASSGGAGETNVDANSITLEAAGSIDSVTFGSGSAGIVDVIADKLTIVGASSPINTGITASAELFSRNEAGRVNIEVNELIIEGSDFHDDAIGSGPQVGIGAISRLGSSESAGEVTIDAERILVLNGGVISTSTFGEGNAGKVTIEAREVSVSGVGPYFHSAIGSSAEQGSVGNGGEVSVHADVIELKEGGFITTRTQTSGDAGSLVIAADEILITGSGQSAIAAEAASQIGSTAAELASGNAGEITIKGSTVDRANRLELRNGGIVSSQTDGTGSGGAITITAQNIIIDDAGSGVTAASSSSVADGVGGDINIFASSLEMTDGGTISAKSTGPGLAGDVYIALDNSFTAINGDVTTGATVSDGGNIVFEVNDLILLVDSQITTSVESGTGGGGRIDIDPTFVVLDNSKIIANAFGGPGGTIDITTDFLLQTSNSVIEAVGANERINGVVNINAPTQDISGSVTPLQTRLDDTIDVLATLCAQRPTAKVIRFTCRKYEKLPDSPSALRASFSSLDPSSGRSDGRTDMKTSNIMNCDTIQLMACSDDQ